MRTDSIPRIAHFVFGLRRQDEPFHLVHYLALASCRAVVRPEEIHLHCGELPYGLYWDLAREFVTLHRIDPVATVADHDYADPVVAWYSYAHAADFVRLEVLREHGGMYADIDTLFVSPPRDELWNSACVIGRESDVLDQRTGLVRSSLSNALIMATPGSSFIERWRVAAFDAFDGTWAAHSCLLADDLAAEHPSEVRIEPERAFQPFPPTPAGLRRLLVDREDDLSGVTSIHLAAHLWWDESRTDFLPDVHARSIDERRIRARESTYAAAAARFLPDHGYF